MSGVCSQCYRSWCSSYNSPPTLPKLLPLPIPTQAVDGNSFTIMQFNANGIGNKLTELGEFVKRHNVKVIQESKLTLIHKSINFSQKPESQETLVEPHLEELTITATLGDHYQRLHTTGKLLHRRLPPFPGSSDDDDGHPNTG